MALEDAAVLGNLLASVEQPADIETAFKGCDAVRRVCTQKLVTMSREASI